MDMSHFKKIRSAVDGYLDCFLFLDFMHNAAINVHVHVFVWYCDALRGRVPTSAITGRN